AGQFAKPLPFWIEQFVAVTVIDRYSRKAPSMPLRLIAPAIFLSVHHVQRAARVAAVERCDRAHDNGSAGTGSAGAGIATVGDQRVAFEAHP
ncbi:hypothetical protein ABTD98_19900, partial [Acinetobacter baumannii]